MHDCTLVNKAGALANDASIFASAKEYMVQLAPGAQPYLSRAVSVFVYTYETHEHAELFTLGPKPLIGNGYTVVLPPFVGGTPG